jgi:hypothetical protein
VADAEGKRDEGSSGPGHQAAPDQPVSLHAGDCGTADAAAIWLCRREWPAETLGYARMTVTVEVRGLEQLKQDLARLAAGVQGRLASNAAMAGARIAARHAQGGSRRG